MEKLTKLNDKWYEVEKQYKLKMKIIPKVENSTKSYSYFNLIASSIPYIFIYDFALLEKKKEGNLQTSLYQLVGETTFNGLYNFVRMLEENQLFYRIERIDIKTKRFKNPFKEEDNDIIGIGFEIEIKAFSDPSKKRDEKATFVKMLNKIYNPFYPLILEKLPPNDKNLPDVENSKLYAITKEGVYLIDQKGKLRKLKVGDPVYLGYLTKIDLQNNTAQFTLNKGGIIDKIVLSMKNTNKKEENK